MSRRVRATHDRMGASAVLRSPAKLNLTLEVLGRREDGLHRLRSIMVPLGIFDEMRIEPGGKGVEFTCDPAELQANNLVERAVHALSLPNANLRVHLRKHIPTGAGMGGGSSDAATIVLAAQDGLLGVVPELDYVALARSLGSDVPFFLTQTAALVEDTGERVTPLGAVPAWHAVVVRPDAAVSTAWAYEALDAAGARASRPRSESVSIALGEALQRGEFERVLSLMQNDFHDVLAARVPSIARAAAILEAAGATKPMLTGSGSCVFALARNTDDARRIADRVQLPPTFAIYIAPFWNGEQWRSAA